jgi:hypothetical protein
MSLKQGKTEYRLWLCQIEALSVGAKETQEASEKYQKLQGCAQNLAISHAIFSP